MKKGIDISTYQQKVNYKKLKESGIDFVIIRGGYGKMLSQKDSMFETHYKGCKAVGLNVGVYWYSYAESVEDAKREALTCETILQGKQFEYPIYYDLEEKRIFSTGKTNEIAKTFCNFLESKGYFAGIYISRSPAQTYLTMDVRNRYAMWLAEYGSKLNYNGQYGIWQYSGSGSVSGIKGAVDLDYSYIDYPKIIKAKGLNGFKADAKSTGTTAETKTADTTAKAYKKGDAVNLYHASLYVSADARKYTRQISGTFYIYDGEKVNGRYRITTQKSYCGKKPAGTYVTGYVELDG